MPAQNITFADLADQQLHQLCGLLAVPHGGQDRAAMMAGLAALGAVVYGDDIAITGMSGANLRNLAQAQGLQAYGTKQQIAVRLRDQANPPPVVPVAPIAAAAAPVVDAMDQPVTNPPDISIRSLPDLLDHVEHRGWENEIQTIML